VGSIHRRAQDGVRRLPRTGFLERLTLGHALVVCGCEGHVCVLQTTLGLISHGRKVFVVHDATG
jgi:isochorismate hydrolase